MASAARALGTFVFVAMATGAPAGQTRPQEVLVPGVGVALKAGWQMLFHDGCRFAVPPGWRSEVDGVHMISTDGSTLIVWAPHAANWTTHAAQLKSALHAKSFREDTSTRLWIEMKRPGGVEHYVAATDGTTICDGVLEISQSTSMTVEDTARIVRSVGAAPADWPPAVK